MDTVSTLALALGTSWAAGLNLYAAVLVVGLMANFGGIHLPPGLEVLQNPFVLGAAGIMYVIEFFVDKTPGLDSAWDSVHTFIRIPAGAILAAKALGPVDPSWQLVAGLVGGTLAAGSHATKAGSRLLINTSPEPLSNWGASLAEDALVIGGLWTALHHPIIFLVLLCAFIALTIYLLPKIWRSMKRVGVWLKQRLFGKPKVIEVP